MRPASVVTMPSTTTLAPRGRRRASAIATGPAAGVEDGIGVTVGTGVAEGAGVGVGAAVGVGVGVGLDVGSAVGVGVGLAEGAGVGVGEGVGAAVTTSSPGPVALRRYPVEPEPLLSRWPSGPVAATTSPRATDAPASAPSPATTRIGPLPSSTKMPRPSASASGAWVTVPEIVTRRPSNPSPSAPVATSSGAGRSPAPR